MQRGASKREQNGALGETLVLSPRQMFTPWYRPRGGAASHPYRPRLPRTSVNEPLEIGAIECSALFLEIIVAARCEKPSATPRRAEAEESSRGFVTEVASAGHFKWLDR